MSLSALILVALACGSITPGTGPGPTPSPVPSPGSIPVPVPAPGPAPAPSTTPASLYAECKDRVEGPEADDECKTDADCARVGCGNEVCTTTAAASDLMTTCEDRPCFAVLDTCGCHDGRCTWTLRAAASPPP